MAGTSWRAAAQLVFILGCTIFPASSAWAQNENETVGFQSNHLFEGGHFGENIDVLNGGLNLSTPIGPKYQVNDRLSYQLVLNYNSKVWDYSDYEGNNNLTVKPYNEGPLGIGFTLNFGRLVQDVHWRVCSVGNPPVECWLTTWKWVTPDGNQHDVWSKESIVPDDHPAEYSAVMATDLSYVKVNAPGVGCAAGEDPGCFTVNTPDGLTYTLGKHVYYDPTIGLNQYRQDNLSFGGWYVTRIEDRTVPPVSGVYPSVTIQYDDSRAGFEHAIKQITDSRGREIVFHNCKYDTAGVCTDTPTTVADNYSSSSVKNRHSIATYQVDVPAFWGNEAVPSTSTDKAGSKAIYAFKYVFTPVVRAHYHNDEVQGADLIDGPVLEMVRLDYPVYKHRGGAGECGDPGVMCDTYSLYFGYTSLNDPKNRGELSCRTLPILQASASSSCSSLEGTEVVFKYEYSYYPYVSLFFSGGKGNTKGFFGVMGGHAGAPDITSASRQVHAKKIVAPGLGTYQWNYNRLVVFGYSNPPMVAVTDAFNNDTVYYYNATLPPLSTDPLSGVDPEDHIAPDWDDGLNYRIEYYKGTGVGTRQLLRSETLEYDSDMSPAPTTGFIKHRKWNSRVSRTATIFHDDGGVETIVANSDWDKFGHWRAVAETGFGTGGTRYTRTQYLDADHVPAVYLSGVFDYREVSDGFRVVARTDNSYRGNDSRLSISIARKTLPGAIGTPRNVTAMASGDTKTGYSYDPVDGSVSDGNIAKKTLSRWVGLPGSEVIEYCIGYKWSQGYLKTKTFLTDCTTNASIGWNAIDRKRDGNTGAIFSAKDAANIETTYNYDKLGRVGDITPVTSGELPTAVDYVSLKETTVTRGSGASYEFSRYKYDGLGRVAREERRPAVAASNYPYRATCYDIANRVTFQSEWLGPTVTGLMPCDPNLPPTPTFIAGSQFDFEGDPFGRVKKMTTATGNITTTTYKGQDSTVTIQNVMGVGPTGGTGNLTTTYFRDGWDRLTMVDAPSEKRCDTWGNICSTNAECGSGHTCAATDGADAIYTYDILDDLVRVDLVDQQTNRTQSRFFEYDGLQRLYQASNPENGTTVFPDYDSLGNVLSVTDASGITLKSAYDRAGRLLQVSRGPSNVIIAANTYDAGVNAKGKISVVSAFQDDNSLTLNTTHLYAHAGGRLSSLGYGFAGWPGTSTLQAAFSYDPFGNLGAIVYPAGAAGLGSEQTVAYEYSNGIPTVVKDSGSTPLASVTYTPAGLVDTITTRGDAVGQARTQITYDAQNRPSAISMGKWTGSAFVNPHYYDSGLYAYDGAGNISAIGANSYKYDTGNRLKEVHETFGSPSVNYFQCFAYDAFGNIFGKVDRTDSTGTTTCSSIQTWDDLFAVTAPDGSNTNRIQSQQIPGSGPIGFLYDARGNVTKDWERRYLYDSRNRMLSVSRLSVPADMVSSGLELAQYEYGNDGNRVVKRDLQRQLATYYVRGPDGKVLSEFRRTRAGTYVPEWTKHHIYLVGKEVALLENRRPTPPGGLTIWTPNSQGNINLRWKRNPAEENVTVYRLYRSTSGGALTQLADLTTTSTTCPADTSVICYTHATNAVGTQFQYQVTAFSGTVESYGSDIIGMVAGDVTPPSPPTCLTGTAGDRQVSISWTASTSADVMSYNVFRRRGVVGPVYWVTQAYVFGTTYVDSGLTNGANYYYWVRAIDNSSNQSGDVVNTGCNPPLPATFTAMPKDYAPPAPPRNVQVNGSCTIGTATVTWDGNASTDGVTTYWVYRYPDFIPPGPKAIAASITSYADSGLSSSQTYYYWLSAQDDKSNVSVPSEKVGVTERSTSLPVPPGKLRITAGDGQVRVGFQAPVDPSQIAHYVLYRKLNAEPSCSAYQQVDSFPKDTNPLRFTDSTVSNNLAWDYAVTSRHADGSESGFSETALAIPTAPPQNYRECTVPSGTSTPFVSMRWDPPVGKPYHPIQTTTTTGDLSYLQGYHLRRYRKEVGGGGDGDADHLVEEYRGSVSPATFCEMTGASCNTQNGSGCFTWDSCILMGTCSLTASFCVQKADCPAAETCNRTLQTPTDPYILQDAGTSLIYQSPPSSSFQNCNMVSAAYKVYANGTWQTVVSEPTSNFKLRNLSGDPASSGTRCQPPIINPTSSSALACTVAEPPRITSAPSAAQALDANNVAINGSIHVSWTPPANPADLARVAGYYLYISELAVQKQAPYGFTSNQPVMPFVTLGPTQTTYDFSDLPRDYRGLQRASNGTSQGELRYQFQVAIVDFEGRVSEVSPLSTPFGLLATYPAKPAGLKAVIWTTNDANMDGGNNLAVGLFPNPRSMDGIKLQWKSGYWTGLVGFRVYRSESENGPFCAIVKNIGSGNPASVPLCVDTNAYSDSLTRSIGEAGNTRFFHDRSITSGKIYYYKVRAVGSSSSATSETDFSAMVRGIALKHADQPLSPPRHLKAWAPMFPNGMNPFAGGGINLRWCPNPVDEGVTGYKIYRGTASGGPYTWISTLTNQSPDTTLTECMAGSRRCGIQGAATGQPPTLNGPACTVGPSGTCKIVDFGVSYPTTAEGEISQLLKVYYYVVTAMRGTLESAYSVENAGWPNYCATGTCICSGTTCTGTYYERYDPDNLGNIACDDEMAELETPSEGTGIEQSVISSSSDATADIAPYRTIGAMVGSGGGVGGTPSPAVSPRWIFLHSDHLGSPRVITDVSGNVVSTHHYMPFGEEKPILSRVSSNNAKFTGHERDVESASTDNPDGLDYMLARYYSSSLDRFLSCDPSRRSIQPEFPQTWNRYSYTINNPINRVDPDGELSYIVARNGPAYSSHMFVVTHAKYPGDPKAKLHSAGKSSKKGSEGKVGKVDEKTKGLSEGTSETDKKTWAALATGDAKGVDYSTIPAKDGKVASVAEAMLENQEYHLGGPNSNSAAQAIADRAAGSPVPTPEAFDPATGVEDSDKIEFDEKKIKEDEAAGKHEEHVKAEKKPKKYQ